MGGDHEEKDSVLMWEDVKLVIRNWGQCDRKTVER